MIILSNFECSFFLHYKFTVTEKQVGDWTVGKCEGTGENKFCGPGSQKQTRTCEDGTDDKCIKSDREQIVSCPLKDCEKQLGDWNNKGDCEAVGGNHKKCGPAFQLQTRTCKDGTDDKCTVPDRSRKTSCPLKDCEKQLGEWGDAGTCEAIGEDKTCGQGYKQQTRTCSDGTKDKCTMSEREKKTPCQLKDCEKRLGVWENDGNCEPTLKGRACGPGYQRQRRTCTDGTIQKCTASDREKRFPCKLRNCRKQLGTWEKDGLCEGVEKGSNCGSGQQREKRMCTDGTVDKCTTSDRDQMVACPLPKCPSINK